MKKKINIKKDSRFVYYSLFLDVAIVKIVTFQWLHEEYFKQFERVSN
jgi:hypothetical protein